MQQAGLGSVKEAGPLGRRDEARGEALDEWAVNAAVFYSLVHEAEDLAGISPEMTGTAARVEGEVGEAGEGRIWGCGCRIWVRDAEGHRIPASGGALRQRGR